LRMYPLKYCPADQLYRILQNVIDGPNVRLAIDDRSNVLLVTAPRQQLERIDGIVSKLDVPTERGAETPQMMYRVYMVELPSKVEAMKPFSLVAANSSNLSAADIVQAAENTKIRLTNLDMLSIRTQNPECGHGGARSTASPPRPRRFNV
jgi:type II secretory pathway component GspD/PulD (secretin)